MKTTFRNEYGRHNQGSYSPGIQGKVMEKNFD